MTTELDKENTALAVEESRLTVLKKKEMLRRERVFKEYLESDVYRDKIEIRAKIFDACQDNRREFILSRGRVYQLCSGQGIQNPTNNDLAEACIFFIENFGWTFSPKTDPKHLPFILFDFQKKMIKWLIDKIEKGEDGFLEKSREMGASWIVFVYVSLWYWLFRDGANILLGSYKEMLVDDKTSDSLFGKIDYALEAMPKWLMPRKFNPNKHRTKLRLMNPENGNLISGDTMNQNFGRGSRKTAIMFDELGFWDYAKDAWEGAADSTNCRIANSTPCGYNFYAMLRESGIDIHTMHWQDHPFKDNEWYEYEKERRTEESLAQEVDISYLKSLEGRVYPDWNEEFVEQGKFEYDYNLPLYVGWDFGFDDDTAIIWAQPNKGKLRIIDTYRNNYKLIDFYIPFVTGITPSDAIKYSSKDLAKIASHKTWKKGVHFGDPAGRFGNQVVNTTVVEELRNSGIEINFKDAWKHFDRRKTALRLLIRNGIELNMNSDTKYFNLCMINSAYPKVKQHGVDEVRSIKPLHNWSSHYRSAAEYMSLGLSELRPTKRTIKDKIKPRGRGSVRY